MKRLILIVGEICSGKDTIIKDYEGVDYLQIDLGELVREKFKTKERIFNNQLEAYFLDCIKNILNSTDHRIYIITGARQVSLIKKIAVLFNSVMYRYLVAPRYILKQRYINRAATKDLKIIFEDAIKGDESLGMKELQHYLLTEVECDFVKSY